jgi:hypothetical protein
MVFLVVILLASNIVLAFFLFFSGKTEQKRKSREDLAMAFYEDLGLDKQQIDTFKVAKDEYFKEMKPIWGEIRELKDSLYRNMGSFGSDSSGVTMLVLINQKNLSADQKTFQHFIYLRKKLDSSQQAKYDTVIAKMINRPWNRSRK